MVEVVFSKTQMQIFVITTIQVHNANTLDNMCHIIKIQLGM